MEVAEVVLLVCKGWFVLVLYKLTLVSSVKLGARWGISSLFFFEFELKFE
jgi:hypothetical protein